MRRREFVAWIGGGGVAWASALRAQNSAVRTIGYLSSKDEASEANITAGIRKGLAERGLIEGQSVSITYRWSAGDYRRLPELAADLVTRNVDVIAASGLPAALAA